MKWAEQIRAARKRKGVTQVELAKRLGISQPAVSDVERGREDVTIGRAIRIAEALGMNVVMRLEDK